MCTQWQQSLALATHDHSQSQELCPVARWLIVHCWQQDRLDQASTKERKHLNSPFVEEGDWWCIQFFLEIKISHWWWFTGRSRNTCMSEWCRPSSWQRCLCESLFECMMQIIVLLKLLVQGQCWFQLLIMTCCWYIPVWHHICTILSAQVSESSPG